MQNLDLGRTPLEISSEERVSEARLTTRVLCVGAEAAMREVLTRSLEPEGFELAFAHSGVDSLSRLQQRRYPVVIVDDHLLGLDALTLVQRLQALHPESKFLLLTQQSSCGAGQSRAFDGGCIEVVNKPFAQGYLIRVLHRVIELGHEPAWHAVNSVLLVEDNSAESDLVMHHLSVWPYGEPPVVTRVSSLQEAVFFLHAQTVDMILTDLSLSDASGLDAVRRLRAAAPSVAILVLTGLADEELGLRAIQLGADDYLSKSELNRAYLTRAIRRGMERNRAFSRLAHLALRDHLTGLANRTAFMERLQHAITLCKRCDRQVAVGFLDLDKFKSINDTYGHEAGDRVLQQVACRLGSTVRSCDMAARLGGDEFAFILEDAADEKTLSVALDRIQAALAPPLRIEGHGCLELGSSIGVALYPDGGDTVEELLRAADRAMYDAKQRSGGPSFEVHSLSFIGRCMPRVRMQAALRQALARREFELHYQPLYHLKENRVAGLEALLRWRSSEGGCNPAQFIPVLEDCGLIVDVGRWVIRTACAQIRRLYASGHRVRIAVNISPLQFVEDDLCKVVKDALVEARVAPSDLELEITERLLMQDSAKVSQVLAQLKQLGVRLSLDDFGTGYSSLSHLNRFPADVLKIDRVFAQQMREGSQGASVAAAVVELGRTLGLEIVAEGVENHAQLEFFTECGCDLAQGYLLGVPSPDWPLDSSMCRPQQEALRAMDSSSLAL